MRLLTGGTLMVAALVALLVHGHASDRAQAHFTRSPADVASFVVPSAAARRHELRSAPLEIPHAQGQDAPAETAVE